MKKLFVLTVLLLVLVACKQQVAEKAPEMVSQPEAQPAAEIAEKAPAVVEKPESKTLLKTGIFRTQNRQTSGNVKMYLVNRLDEEFYLKNIENLKIEAFKTDNLDSTYVYLTTESLPRSVGDLERGNFDLGKLASYSGMQSLTLPAAVDASAYTAIAIVQKQPEAVIAYATFKEEEKDLSK